MPADRTLRVLDADYPRPLRELDSPPDPLHLRGELPRGRGVAIVGTRAATPEALSFARTLARSLASAGIAVYSGGAAGIDAAAHQGALEAGGKTVVVAGTGLDRTYPEEHGPLYERIVASGGALVSPFEADQRGAPWTFLKRNPVLVALADVTVVVQAPLKSGARSAAAAARKLGRPLLVVPASPWDPHGAGCFAELCLGATSLTTDADVFRALGVRPPARPLAPAVAAPPRPPSPAPARASTPRKPVRPPSDDAPTLVGDAPTLFAPALVPSLPLDLPAPFQTVLQATGPRPLHVDDLCALTGLSAPLVHEALLTLTLHAVLVEGPSGCFRRTSS